MIKAVIEGISWRCISILITTVIGFLVTGSWVVGGIIAISEVLPKILGYAIHRKMWEKISG